MGAVPFGELRGTPGALGVDSAPLCCTLPLERPPARRSPAMLARRRSGWTFFAFTLPN
jgi:hypothetical protein